MFGPNSFPMRSTIMLFSLLFSTLSIDAQVIDFTPSGAWKNFELQTSHLQDYHVIAATDTNDHKAFYLLREQLEGGAGNPELVELSNGKTYTSITYVGSEGEGPADLQYFIGVDTLDQSYLIALENSEQDIIDIPISGNWRLRSTVVKMSDGVLHFTINDIDTGEHYPVTLSGTVLTILDTTGYEYVGDVYGDNQTRAYSRYDSIGQSYLAYYDIQLGYVKTTIPALYFEMISGSPGDSIHSLAAHGKMPEEGKIYRVVGATFNEVTIPGAPYK